MAGSALAAASAAGPGPTKPNDIFLNPNRAYPPSCLSDGLPFVFGRFQFLGQITTVFWDGDLGLRPNGQLTFAPSPGSGTRRHEMPLNHNVLRFRRR